jgi:alpha-galactosidase
VIGVDQSSNHNRELFTRGNQVAWAADVPDSLDKYVAVFNLDDRTPGEVTVRWGELGLGDKCQVRDLWAKKNLGIVSAAFTPKIEAHGAGLYRITPQN